MQCFYFPKDHFDGHKVQFRMISIPFAGSWSPITKTNWEGIGIQPDVRVNEEDALDTACLLALKAIIKKSTDEKWKKMLKPFITQMEKEKKN